MKLRCIFLFDAYDQEWSLIDAWSEEQIEDNPEWEKRLAEARAEGETKVISIQVPPAELRKALAVPAIKASVKS